MCQLCKGEGIVRSDLSLGALYQPCYCEAAQKRQQKAVEEIECLLAKIDEMKQTA